MKKLLIILTFLVSSVNADIHVSKNGEILDPGMYWAVNARYAIEDIKKGKGNKSKLMRHLLNSASYGFNPSRFAIGMIYANGSNGFNKDLPRAYAWLKLAAKGKNKNIFQERDRIKNNLSDEEIKKANKILISIEKRYGNDVAFKKFRKWIDTETTVVGSRVKGNHSYLNVRHSINGLESISHDELIKRLNRIYDSYLIDQGYEVKPQEIITSN